MLHFLAMASRDKSRGGEGIQEAGREERERVKTKLGLAKFRRGESLTYKKAPSLGCFKKKRKGSPGFLLVMMGQFVWPKFFYFNLNSLIWADVVSVFDLDY